MTRKAVYRLLAATCCRLRRDEHGAVLPLLAVMATVLLAVTGFAVDAGWWYTLQRQNQSGADAGAISAAYEVINDNTNLAPAATKAATDNRYAGAVLVGSSPPPGATSCGPTSVSRVCYPYSSDKVEVILRQPQSAWFAAVTGLGSVNVVTRAVAKVTNLSNACVYLMNDDERALSVIGSAQFSLPTCAVCSDSTAADSIYIQGGSGATLSADAIVTAGGWDSTGTALPTVNSPIQVGAAGCADPWASVLTHSFLTSGMPPSSSTCTRSDPSALDMTVTGSCRISGTDLVAGGRASADGTTHMSADTAITGGWTILNETVDLAPGTYWIADGDLSLGANAVLKCSACSAGGAGVTIILTTAGATPPKVGNVSQAGNAIIESLNAPSSGSFQNLLLIQDTNGLPTGTTFTSPNPCTESCSEFRGSTGHTLEGLIYMPNTDLTFQGNPTSANGCLLIVADTLTVVGNALTTSLASNGCPIGGPGGVAGGIPDPLKTVALVE